MQLNLVICGILKKRHGPIICSLHVVSSNTSPAKKDAFFGPRLFNSFTHRDDFTQMRMQGQAAENSVTFLTKLHFLELECSMHIINRPGVAGAVLLTASSLIH